MTRGEVLAQAQREGWGPRRLAAALGVSKQRAWQLLHLEQHRAYNREYKRTLTLPLTPRGKPRRSGSIIRTSSTGG